MSSDIELTPVPPKTDVKEKQMADMISLLQDLSAHSVTLEEGQSLLLDTVGAIKNNQQSIETKLTAIHSRPTTVEQNPAST